MILNKDGSKPSIHNKISSNNHSHNQTKRSEIETQVRAPIAENLVILNQLPEVRLSHAIMPRWISLDGYASDSPLVIRRPHTDCSLALGILAAHTLAKG
jgi:hypothetical protein